MYYLFVYSKSSQVCSCIHWSRHYLLSDMNHRDSWMNFLVTFRIRPASPIPTHSRCLSSHVLESWRWCMTPFLDPRLSSLPTHLHSWSIVGETVVEDPLLLSECQNWLTPNFLRLETRKNCCRLSPSHDSYLFPNVVIVSRMQSSGVNRGFKDSLYRTTTVDSYSDRTWFCLQLLLIPEQIFVPSSST